MHHGIYEIPPFVRVLTERYNNVFSAFDFVLAFEQVLRGALVAGREKQGDLATTSLDFEYPHRKKKSMRNAGWRRFH